MTQALSLEFMSAGVGKALELNGATHRALLFVGNAARLFPATEMRHTIHSVPACRAQSSLRCTLSRSPGPSEWNHPHHRNRQFIPNEHFW